MQLVMAANHWQTAIDVHQANFPDAAGERLADGSVLIIEPGSKPHPPSSIISREVDGVCVWGQGFAASNPDEHAAQVARVADHMRSDPGAFRRWYL